MAITPFFPDYETFQAWVQCIPGIVPRQEDPKDPRLADPHDPCYPNTEGPYYVAPGYLLLRVGSGAHARYNVLVRVNNEAEADYRWYVPATQPDQDRQTVFAAYLRDRRKKPAIIVGGATLREAKKNLEAFMATKSGHSKLTRLLS